VFGRVVYPVLARHGRPRLRSGLERSKVFFPYFSMNVSYDDLETRRRLEPAGISAPPIETYFDRLLSYAARAAWGREPVSRAEASRATAAPPAPRPRPTSTAREETASRA
jgi:hypothetical protein